MDNIKLAYQKHNEEDEENQLEPPISEQDGITRGTNRSAINENMNSKDPQQQQQLNHSYLVTYTQGNMTTNSNNLSISKVDLNGIQGRYKSANKTQLARGIENADYPIDSNDIHLMSVDNPERGRQHQQSIIRLEMQEITKAISTKNNGKEQDNRGIINGNNNNKNQKEDLNGGINKIKSRGGGGNQQSKKRHVIDLQIDIPDSDDERQQEKTAKERIKKLKEIQKQKRDQEEKEKLQQQQPQKQKKQQNIFNQDNASSNTSVPRISNSNSNRNGQEKGSDNPESARVNEIIQHNRLDVENLQTIQIDYDSETIEGLTDDQCLELYCEGSVKLKNSQRLHCKLAYEQLLVDKIRSTTRLIYTNLGITNSGNLSSSEFIVNSVVAPIKQANPKFKTTDISEAFTVQCADYIHFKQLKILARTVKFLYVMSLLQLIACLLKFQDPTYQSMMIAQGSVILVGIVQLFSTYFFISGVNSCSNENVRRSLQFNVFFFILNIIQIILEFTLCSYFSDILNYQILDRDNFKQFVVYAFCFLAGIVIPPIIHQTNKNTTTSIRKIVKIVSDEFID